MIRRHQAVIGFYLTACWQELVVSGVSVQVSGFINALY